MEFKKKYFHNEQNDIRYIELRDELNRLIDRQVIECKGQMITDIHEATFHRPNVVDEARPLSRTTVTRMNVWRRSGDR